MMTDNQCLVVIGMLKGHCSVKEVISYIERVQDFNIDRLDDIFQRCLGMPYAEKKKK